MSAHLVPMALIVVGEIRDTIGSSVGGSPGTGGRTESPPLQRQAAREDHRLTPLIRPHPWRRVLQIGQKPPAAMRFRCTGKSVRKRRAATMAYEECIFLRNKLFCRPDYQGRLFRQLFRRPLRNFHLRVVLKSLQLSTEK